MRQFNISLTALFLFLTLSPIGAQENIFISEVVERLENSRKYVLQVANAMPEDKYGYKAAPESLSFSENLMHIGFALDWHCQSLLGGREARDWNTDTIYKTDNKSKAEMIAVIDETFNEAISFLKGFDPQQLDEKLDYFGLDRSKRQIVMLMAEHIVHHRAQMLVQMRLNGLTPPRFVLYQ